MRDRSWTRRALWGAVALAAAAVVAGALGGMPGPVEASPGPGGPSCERARVLTPEDREAIGGVIMNRVKERLGLSDQQAEDIRATLKARREAAREEWRALCEARLELRGLMARQDADPAALRAAADRLQARMARLMDLRLDGHLALRGKLTPEQWAKWVELRREMGARRGGARAM